MKVRVEAKPEELLRKGGKLLRRVAESLSPSPEAELVLEALNKAEGHEPEARTIVHPALKQLHDRMEAAYKDQLEKMVEDITAVVAGRHSLQKGGEDFRKALPHDEPIKIGKKKAVYKSIPESWYSCRECVHWIPGGKPGDDRMRHQCVKHGEDDYIKPNGTCVAFEKGEPVPARKTKGQLTKESSQYHENEYHTGFRCSRCKFYERGGSCSRVEGEIIPEDTCILWEVLRGEPVPVEVSEGLSSPEGVPRLRRKSKRESILKSQQQNLEGAIEQKEVRLYSSLPSSRGQNVYEESTSARVGDVPRVMSSGDGVNASERRHVGQSISKSEMGDSQRESERSSLSFRGEERSSFYDQQNGGSVAKGVHRSLGGDPNLSPEVQSPGLYGAPNSTKQDLLKGEFGPTPGQLPAEDPSVHEEEAEQEKELEEELGDEDEEEDEDTEKSVTPVGGLTPKGYKKVSPGVYVRPKQEAEQTSQEEARLKEWLLRGNFGIDRIDMPQIKSALVPEFIKELQGSGVKVERGEAQVGQLKATQKELHMDKVRKFATDPKASPHLKKPVIVSSDGHLLDGHHRWAALAMQDPTEEIQVVSVNLPIDALLKRAKAFGGVEFKKSILDEFEEMLDKVHPALSSHSTQEGSIEDWVSATNGYVNNEPKLLGPDENAEEELK